MGTDQVEQLIDTLLKERGVVDANKEAFLAPNWERGTHDPFLLSGMMRAVERIEQAMKDGEKIAIYSDFDADGIPGAVVLHDFFSAIKYTNIEVYIPHRNTEGFGVHEEALTLLSEKGVTLVITVDCGIRAVTAVEHAHTLGIDVIVTDHHLPGDTVPDAFAIVNPNTTGDTYPFKGLCGAAVAFKLVQALLQKGDHGLTPGWEKWLLDMVGIATLSDMVPLIDENRIFAHYGLIVLRKTRRPGLQSLFRKTGVFQKYMTEDDVVFSITPRINAASRMDSPEAAFLALTADTESAGEHVRHLDTINNERKGVVASMIKEIHKKVEMLATEVSVLVLGNIHWQPGLLGLAAQRTAEVYNKPVFLWGKGDASVIKGSARSDGITPLNVLMKQAEHIFLAYGGHTHAGGFSVDHESVHHLSEALNTAYPQVPKIKESAISDAVPLLLDSVSWKLYHALRTLAPFGQDNPRPLFLFEDIVPESVETFGKVGMHLKITLRTSFGDPIEAIQFFTTEDILHKAQEGRISFIGGIDVGGFGGRRNIRIRIEELC